MVPLTINPIDTLYSGIYGVYTPLKGSLKGGLTGRVPSQGYHALWLYFGHSDRQKNLRNGNQNKKHLTAKRCTWSHEKMQPRFLHFP